MEERRKEETARTYAMRVILNKIINLELEPGASVSENELGALLDLSRTPIREALNELSKMELVEIRPQKGSYITKIDYRLIEESKFIRSLIENAVIRQACEKHIDMRYLDKLSETVEKEHKYSETGNIPILLNLDNEFHRIIFESVGKERSYRVVRFQMVHFDRVRALQIRSIPNDRLIKDHENMVYAIKQQDGELAEMIMDKHLTRYLTDRLELIKLYPNYFITENETKKTDAKACDRTSVLRSNI